MTQPSFPPPSTPPPGGQPWGSPPAGGHPVGSQPRTGSLSRTARLVFLATLGLAIGLWLTTVIVAVVMTVEAGGGGASANLISSTFSGSLLIALVLVAHPFRVGHWAAVAFTGLYTIGMVILAVIDLVTSVGQPGGIPVLIYVLPLLVALAGSGLAALRSLRSGLATSFTAMNRWIPIAIVAASSIVGQIIYAVSAIAFGGSGVAMLAAWIPSMFTTLAILAVLVLPILDTPWTPFVAAGLSLFLAVAQLWQIAFTPTYFVVSPLLRMLLYIAAAGLLVVVGIWRLKENRVGAPGHPALQSPPQQGWPQQQGWSHQAPQPGPPQVQNPYSQQR